MKKLTCAITLVLLAILSISFGCSGGVGSGTASGSAAGTLSTDTASPGTVTATATVTATVTPSSTGTETPGAGITTPAGIETGAPTNPTDSATAYAFSSTWGSVGTGDGQFNSPQYIAIDNASGSIFVTDSYNHRVEKFNMAGEFIAKWGSLGYGNGQFGNQSEGIAIDTGGNVYVTSLGQGIQKFNKNGLFISKIITPDCPWSLSFDSSGNLICVINNMHSSTIQKYSPDGTLMMTWDPDSLHTMLGAMGLALDSSDNMYIADGGNYVQKFSASGEFVTKWGGLGAEDGQFKCPNGLAADSSDNIYVTDNTGFQEFTSSGEFLAKWRNQGADNEQFDVATGIDVDSSGNVYVVDTGNNRVQVFAPAP